MTLLAVCMLGGGAAVTPAAYAGPIGDYDSVPRIQWMRDSDPATPGHQLTMVIQVGSSHTGLAGRFEFFEQATVPTVGNSDSYIDVSGGGANLGINTATDVTSSSRFSVRFTSDNDAFASKNFENLRAVCGPGRYSADGYGPCTLAPAGEFVDVAGQTSSIPCPPGTYQPDTGQMLCLLSPPGTYTNYSGSTEVIECMRGEFQPNSGATTCISADIGFFVDIFRATTQYKCPEGFTTSSTGQWYCDVTVETTTTTLPTTTTPPTTTTLPTLCCAPPTTTVPATGKRKPSIPTIAKKVKVGRTVTIALKNGRNTNGLVTTVSSTSKTCKVRKSTKGYVVSGRSKGVCSITIVVKGNTNFSSASVRRTISVTK